MWALAALMLVLTCLHHMCKFLVQFLHQCILKPYAGYVTCPVVGFPSAVQARQLIGLLSGAPESVAKVHVPLLENPAAGWRLVADVHF